MLISDLLELSKNDTKVEFVHEREFDHFARATSSSNSKNCIFLSNAKYVDSVDKNTEMIITTKEIYSSLALTSTGFCLTDNPKALFWDLVNTINSRYSSIKQQTSIDQTAVVSPQAYIEDGVIIGAHTIVEPFACIYSNTSIGKDCIIHSGVRLGIQDFNFYTKNDQIIPIVHAGKTIIGDRVSVGYNSVIGKAVFDYNQTIIDNNTIISNCSCIGHDAHLSNNVMIGGCSLIAGYTTIGHGTDVSMGVTVRNGLTIGNNVKINMGSVVILNIDDGKTVFGNPARKWIPS